MRIKRYIWQERLRAMLHGPRGSIMKNPTAMMSIRTVRVNSGTSLKVKWR